MAASIFTTLIRLRGNPRACVYTEPLWGLGMNLCIPYASVYMLALGLKDAQIGFIATVLMLSQMTFAFLSGPLVDKMGRRLSTAVFDAIAYIIPCLLWWRAESLWFFVVAAILNGANKATHCAWNCLMIEDADKKQIPHLYLLITVFSQFCVFFAPISSILVLKLTLVPAVRILYINALILMTSKLVILYIVSRETKIGLARREETRGKSVLELTAGYHGVVKIIARSGGTLFSIFILLLSGIIVAINNTFWSVIASKKILVPDPLLPMFPMIKSFLAILFLVFVMPRVSGERLKIPLIAGLACYFAGQALLVFVPAEGAARYALLSVSLAFDGFGFGACTMLADSLIALNVNQKERARVLAIVHVVVMAATAPFGWIGGILSEISRDLPFILNLCLIAAGIFVTLLYYKRNPETIAVSGGVT